MLTADKAEKELFQEARQAEAEGNFDKAAGLYTLLIRKNNLQSSYYDRLMILYHRQREFAAELALINKGIHAFENYFSSRGKKIISQHGSKVGKLSQAFMKKTGLTKEGVTYQPEPLNKWNKRKALVEKKILQQKKRAV